MGVRFDVPCRLGGFERALSGFVLLFFVTVGGIRTLADALAEADVSPVR